MTHVTIDWNVVVTSRPDGFHRARRRLADFGRVQATSYWNVLVMSVPDARALQELVLAAAHQDRAFALALSRLVPVDHKFRFDCRQTFELRLAELAGLIAPALRDRSFHVRMHRRGSKESLSSQAEERVLADLLLGHLAEGGNAGRVVFGDPDCVVALESVDDQAGVSIWSRDDRHRYPWLRFDG